MSGLFLALAIFTQVSILDLPRHYAKQGDIESAIRAYSEIYRTSLDSVIKYQALYEQALLYLEKHDTISAISNLYKLSQRFMPDSIAENVFKLLFKLDRSRLGNNAVKFAHLYPSVSERERLLVNILRKLEERGDTTHYLEVLRILASDYGRKYRKKLSAFIYENDMEDKVFPDLFDVNSEAPYYYYIHKGDTFDAFYTLFGRRDAQSRRLRLKILYDLGAYDACLRMIGRRENDYDLVKMKVLSAVKKRMRADSIVSLVKSYKTNGKLYRKILSLLDTLRDYGLLRALLKKNPEGALLNAQGASSGLRDTVFFNLAKWLSVKGYYGFAKALIDGVENYYPMDTLLMWKDYLQKKRKMPQDILLERSDIIGKVKELFDNGYYAELVQYAKGRELPKQLVPYITESLYMLWKLYGRRGYLKGAFKLAEKYRELIPRDIYFRIVYDYDPREFDIERYNYRDLTPFESYLLFYLLKAQNKVKLIKDFKGEKTTMFLYYLALGNPDSALFFIPENQLFYGMFLKEFSPKKTEDSLKVFNYFKSVKLDYMKSPAKFIVKTLIEYALSLKDYLAADSLLRRYEEYYGKDRYWAYSKARWHYTLGDYRESLVYSLFYGDAGMQAVTAASLLKLGRIQFVNDLRLDEYDLNLLYLKTGALSKVNVALLDRGDALSYLNELTKSRIDKSTLKNVLSIMLKKNVIDSMTFNVYGIFYGFVNRDSVYLNAYAKSFLKYLTVKTLMRKNLLDSALLVIGNPESDVDSFKYHLYFKKGTIMYLKHRYKKAYEYYRKAEGLKSLKDAAMFNAYLSSKRASLKENTLKSLTHYIENCIRCEKLPDAYISLGFNLIEAGRSDSAISVMRNVEGYLNSGQEAELKYWLGTAYMQDSLFKNAAGYFLRVYKFHQKDGQWGDTGGLNAARLCYVLGLKNKAKKIYTAIIKKRKNDALAEEAKKEISILK